MIRKWDNEVTSREDYGPVKDVEFGERLSA